jgi:hypothetical protein
VTRPPRPAGDPRERRADARLPPPRGPGGRQEQGRDDTVAELEARLRGATHVDRHAGDRGRAEDAERPRATAAQHGRRGDACTDPGADDAGLRLGDRQESRRHGERDGRPRDRAQAEHRGDHGGGRDEHADVEAADREHVAHPRIAERGRVRGKPGKPDPGGHRGDERAHAAVGPPGHAIAQGTVRRAANGEQPPART